MAWRSFAITPVVLHNYAPFLLLLALSSTPSNEALDDEVAHQCVKVCDFYGKCQKINGSENCVCQAFCIEGEKPVCGDNGKNYTSKCHLEMDSCRQKKMIKVKQLGFCGSHDPCLTKKCNNYAVCQVDEKGLAKCICPTICAHIYSPICGSDGKTYNSECTMKVKACKQNKTIVKKHEEVCEKPGMCPKVSVSCKTRTQLCSLDEACPGSFKCCLTSKCTQNCTRAWPGICKECSKNNTYCELHDNSEHVYCTKCPSYCPPDVIDPKCGSDKKTYASTCFVDYERCHNNKNIKIVYNGSCHRMKRHHGLVVGLSVGITTMVVCMLIVGGVLYYRHRKSKRGDEVLEVPFLDRDSL